MVFNSFKHLIPSFSLVKTFICYTGIGYINSFMSINMLNPLKSSLPLPDLMFDLFSHVSDLIPHGMLFLLTCVTLFKLRKNSETLIGMYNRISLLFVLRVLCFTMTRLPPPQPGCVSREIGEAYHWNVVRDLVESRALTCSDMMFSGHAIHFVAFWHVLYSDLSFWGRIGLGVYVGLGLVSIVASHLHYSADVLVGAALTFLVFRLG